MSLCYHCCDICGMWENGIVGHVIGFCVCVLRMDIMECGCKCEL